MGWKHDDLAADLAAHLRSDSAKMVWTDMQMGPSGSSRPDVYVMEKRYSVFAPKSYEIKVSLSDFRSDVTSGKWQSYLEYSAAVIFAVPAGLISKNEIPDGCGLIVRHENVWRMAKKPTLQKIDTLPHKVWMKLLIDGAAREAERKFRKEYFSHYQVQSKIKSDYGRELATLLSDVESAKELLNQRIQGYEDAMQRAKDWHERDLNRLKERLESDITRVDDGMSELKELLGLEPECRLSQVSIKIHEVIRALDKDSEVSRLRRKLEQVERAVQGIKPDLRVAHL